MAGGGVAGRFLKFALPLAPLFLKRATGAAAAASIISSKFSQSLLGMTMAKTLAKSPEICWFYFGVSNWNDVDNIDKARWSSSTIHVGDLEAASATCSIAE